MTQTETDFLASLRSVEEHTAALAAGVGEKHFVARLPEWRWLCQYISSTREFPPDGLLVGQFSDFQPSEAVGAYTHHLGLLQQAYVRRNVFAIIEQEANRLEEREDPTAVARTIATRLLELTATQATNRGYVDADAPERAVRLEAAMREEQTTPIRGIPTGVEPLDVMGRGWSRGQLAAYISRPGVGKTEFVICASAAAWMAGHRVIFFTIEMSKEEIFQRADPVVSTLLGFSGPTNTQLQSANTSAARLSEYQKYAERVGQRDDWLLVDGSASAMDLADVLALARQHRAELIVIDGAKLLNERGGSEWERYASIIRGCKRMAMQEQVAVLIVEHAYSNDRRTRTSDPDPPSIDDVFMGKVIGQEADVIVSLSVPRQDGGLRRWLTVPKNRGGLTLDRRKLVSCDIDRGDVGRWLDDDEVRHNSELAPWLDTASPKKDDPPPEGLVLE